MIPAARLVPVVTVVTRADGDKPGAAGAAAVSVSASGRKVEPEGRGPAGLLRLEASGRLSSAGITCHPSMCSAPRQTIAKRCRICIPNLNQLATCIIDVGVTMFCSGNRSAASQGGHQLIRDWITVKRPGSRCSRQERLKGQCSGENAASEVRFGALREPVPVCLKSTTPGGDMRFSIAASVHLHQASGVAQRPRSPAIAARGPQRGRRRFACRAATGDAGGLHGAERPHGADQQSVQEALSAAEAALADAQEKLADVESLPSAREPWQSRVRGLGSLPCWHAR